MRGPGINKRDILINSIILVLAAFWLGLFLALLKEDLTRSEDLPILRYEYVGVSGESSIFQTNPAMINNDVDVNSNTGDNNPSPSQSEKNHPNDWILWVIFLITGTALWRMFHRPGAQGDQNKEFQGERILLGNLP